MSVRGRIGAALAANAFGQAVTVGARLLLTPLYFRVWGAALYGEWLILSSIPAYLTMADLGIGSAAGNDMTMRASAGDRVGAQRTMRAAWWVALASALVVTLFGIGAAAVAWLWQWPHTPDLQPAQAAMVLVGLALTVAFGFAGGVVSAGFRCCERNAQGILWSNVTRLVEALCLAGLLFARQPPEWLCGAMVAVRALSLLVQTLHLRSVCPWLFAPGVHADIGVVRRLAGPALGFMAFPLGNALALQGPILVIGAVFGGPAVAMFSALRTLARIPVQLTSMFNASVWPEMSRAFGAGDMELVRRLHRTSWSLTALLTAVVGAALALAGPWIVHLWLGTTAAFEAVVFDMLVLLTVFSALWNASSVVLVATNSHLRLGAVYIVTNAVCLGLAFVAGRWGWGALLAALVGTEVVLLAWVLPAVLRLSGDDWRGFLAGAVREWRKRLTT